VETGPVEIDFPIPFVAVVALARPPVNALDRATRERLLETFDALQEREDVRAIVLTGRGTVFCAGADIKERQSLAQGDLARATRLTREAFFGILDSAQPVIAAVNGPALGAGFVLAACCDMIFASERAVFAMPEIDVGLGGGASFLQRILPPGKMRRMMLTGERVPASELHRLGAVESCVGEDELLPVALHAASVIASKSPAAVRTIRASFCSVESLGLRDGFRLEQAYTTELSKTDDASEARQAFLEKRQAMFGRHGFEAGRPRE
jgi:enoyl-CoA hydratase